jgi:hypothetical protein
VNDISNAEDKIMHMAAVILTTLIHPIVRMEKTTKPGSRYIKHALEVYLLLFSNKWFSIMKNGTKPHSSISPGHQPVHASPEIIPPHNERVIRIYLFIKACLP